MDTIATAGAAAGAEMAGVVVMDGVAEMVGAAEMAGVVVMDGVVEMAGAVAGGAADMVATVPMQAATAVVAGSTAA
ncbi:MAG: hypothetical protein ACYCPO_04335 [Acidobacteriaceae bacterium]